MPIPSPQIHHLLLLSSLLLTTNAINNTPNLRTTTLTPSAQNDLITSLPGLSYTPTFRQFSGYLTVNATNSRNLFYWFVESQSNPETAPVVFWTNGGPGCSGLLGFGTEMGPYHFHSNGTLTENPYSWNQVANMLFVEQPAGVGFSYSLNEKDDYVTGDAKAARDNYVLIQRFFERYPQFKRNEFYIASESYGGHYIPQLTKTILEQNVGDEFNFKGFAVGNPYVDPFSNTVTQYEAYYSHGLLAKPLFDAWHDNCSMKETYAHHPFKCQVLEANMFAEMGKGINPYALDFPVCLKDEVLPLNIFHQIYFLKQIHPENDYLPTPEEYEPCAQNYVSHYLNRQDVQEALHVEQPPKKWTMCSNSISYSPTDIDTSQIDLYRQLVSDLGPKHNLNMLVFSGDDDSICSTAGTQFWIYDLGVNPKSLWKAWKVEGQTAGYVTKFDVTEGSFTFVTVHGAGHEVPAYKPKEALVLLKNFLSGEW